MGENLVGQTSQSVCLLGRGFSPTWLVKVKLTLTPVTRVRKGNEPREARFNCTAKNK